MREVYIGNGETILVSPSTTLRKEYDWVKLQQYLSSGIEVDVGMKEDWYWTGKTLEQSDIDEKKVAGISGSDWATPSVMLNDEYIDCYIEISNEPA